MTTTQGLVVGAPSGRAKQPGLCRLEQSALPRESCPRLRRNEPIEAIIIEAERQ